MKQMWKAVFGALASAFWLGTSVYAAQPPSRIPGQINSAERVEVSGSATRRPATSKLLGALPGDTRLTRMALVLAPSATQQAVLDQLLLDQQNPASASYHKWLTPTQFGAQFGVSDDDLAKIQSWLTSQGLSVLSVAPSRNAVFFSGTSAAVETALGVSMQRYQRKNQEFFENSGNVTVPAALNGIVSGVTSLSSYRLKSNLVRHPRTSAGKASPNYTDGAGDHFLTPWDFRQIYGLNTLVNAGYTGTVKIAVVGQSAINTTQIGYFQTLTGQTVTAPTVVLVPNSGISTAVSGDEGESEIDVEYAGGTASGATIEFVYTGNGNNNGVFDSVIYAVTEGIAPIITMSYGGCESELATYATGTFEPYLRQANAQGETVLVSSGDDDVATCDAIDSSVTVTTATEGLTVSYPASSAYVTAVGGTRFNEGTGTYWSSTDNSFAGSATGYIPEIAWNETADNGTAANGYGILGTGGGASQIFGKPSWQTGTGVPADGQRDLPDVSFNAAVYHDSYLFCSAELTSGVADEACTATAFNEGVGGTSLSAPNFAAMLAIVEQKNATTTGLGNVNGALYSLAAGTSATAIFNDITVGNNIVPCVTGTTNCTTGTMGYSAGVGYDQTTGLGSVNGDALATGLAGISATSAKTPTMTLSAAPLSPAVSTTVTVTVALASPSSTTVPTGTVALTVDGASVGNVTLVSGAATYTVSAGFATVGTHTVVGVYSGDTIYSTATSTLDLVVGATASTSGTFTLASSPTTLTVASGSSGVETITATPAGGFLGVVSFSAEASGTGTLDACYTLPNATVVAAGGTATMTIYTSAAACTSIGSVKIKNAKKSVATSSHPSQPSLPGKGTAVLLSSALLGCFALRRKSRWPLMIVLGLCAMVLPGMGCGSGGSTSQITSPTTPVTSGTSFTITVTGASSINANLTSQTSFTLVID